MYKYKIITTVFLSLSALISVILCVTLVPENVYLAMAYLFLQAAVSIIAVSNTFCIINFWLIVQIYRYHRFEYYVHYKKQIGLVVITYGSMLLLTLAILIAITTTFCDGKNSNEENTGAFFEPHGPSDQGGYCSFWANGFYEVL